MIHAELHPPAGPADEPVPRRGAREEGRLPSPPPPDSPCDDKPSPSASDGGIGNSSVTAAVLLSCCRCWRGCRRRRCSRRQHAAAGRGDQAAAQHQRAPSGPERRRSQLHWLRHAPALDPCSSSSITHSGGSRLKNETPPITELSQERSSMQRPALATPCPLALRSAAAWTRTGTGTRARTRPAPRACPDSTTRRPCRGRREIIEVFQS